MQQLERIEIVFFLLTDQQLNTCDREDRKNCPEGSFHGDLEGGGEGGEFNMGFFEGRKREGERREKKKKKER